MLHSCVLLCPGLDARAAAIVMRAVRNVARNGRTVMVTIHQPSIEIFESFDQLLLIQRGGRTTYFGPLGLHSADLINYFMAVPGTPPLPSGFNPGGSHGISPVLAVPAGWPYVRYAWLLQSPRLPALPRVRHPHPCAWLSSSPPPLPPTCACWQPRGCWR